MLVRTAYSPQKGRTMTNEELARKVKEGESWATLELWEAIKRFVEMKAKVYYARRGNNFRVELDDLIQAGFLAMLDAVEIFDAERGGSYIGMFDLTLKKQFAEVAGIRSSKRDALQYADSTDRALIEEDPDGPTLADTLEDPGGEYAFCLVAYRDYMRYVRQLLDAAMERLTPHAQQYIYQYYWGGQTLDEIAGEGHCKEGPRQVIERGLHHMRRGKFRRELWEALQGFRDFEELRAAGSRYIEMRAISKAFDVTHRDAADPRRRSDNCVTNKEDAG